MSFELPFIPFIVFDGGQEVSARVSQIPPLTWQPSDGRHRSPENDIYYGFANRVSRKKESNISLFERR